MVQTLKAQCSTLASELELAQEQGEQLRADLAKLAAAGSVMGSTGTGASASAASPPVSLSSGRGGLGRQPPPGGADRSIQ